MSRPSAFERLPPTQAFFLSFPKSFFLGCLPKRKIGRIAIDLGLVESLRAECSHLGLRKVGYYPTCGPMRASAPTRGRSKRYAVCDDEPKRKIGKKRLTLDPPQVLELSAPAPVYHRQAMIQAAAGSGDPALRAGYWLPHTYGAEFANCGLRKVGCDRTSGRMKASGPTR